MILKIIIFLISFYILNSASIADVNNADNRKMVQVYKLDYFEREAGVDDYEVRMLVSDRFIRIDEIGEKSGFIIYDDKTKTIFSVAHHDKSVLVINDYDYNESDSPVKSKMEYLQLDDAPKISEKKIYNYRVYVEKNNTEITCLEIQLVENLLPDVSKILKNYQKVISGQQVKMTDNEVHEFQSPCFFVDQIYNTGLYYDKGLPIQEWHSNERYKILSAYEEISVSSDNFLLPEDYKKFSINKNSRTFIN